MKKPTHPGSHVSDRVICAVIVLVLFQSVGVASPGENGGKRRPTAREDSLLTLVQKQTFGYFWEGAEPLSGLIRERIHVDGNNPEHDDNVIAVGGTGMGLMNIIVAIERGFVTREAGVRRLGKIVGSLAAADRFHGAWPHWLDGPTLKVVPFSRNDDGGDLVETAYIAAGLLCVRQYLQSGATEERAIAARADSLWRTVDWAWYRNGDNVLYWHWSPKYGWERHVALHGYNECLITYVLAASSPTHPIDSVTYHEGWARGGAIHHPTTTYGYTLELDHDRAPWGGGSLFWAHYSYLGLDPRGLKDRYADYWQHNVNHTLINYEHCVRNPNHFAGYGPNNWGLTASYSMKWYAAHCPSQDLGVITPSAALSSMPYTPEQSLAAMTYWLTERKSDRWGKYGFYDAFSDEHHWGPPWYIAIDEGPIVAMIENYRSGLLWNLFMSAPEVRHGLEILGFENAVGGEKRGR